MKYVRKRKVIEAMQWNGPAGATRMDDLLAWGAPVQQVAGDPGKIMLTGGANYVVPEKAWIVRGEGRGHWAVRTDAQFRSEYEEPDTPTPEETPFPHWQHFTVRRVGFRKQDDELLGQIVWREGYAGLTRAELDDGQWQPIYEVTEGGADDGRTGQAAAEGNPDL